MNKDDIEKKIYKKIKDLSYKLIPQDVCNLSELKPNISGTNISCKSPLRADKNPSFSFFKGKDGKWLWKDHSENESGNLVQLYIKIHKCNYKAVLEKFDDVVELKRNRPALMTQDGNSVPPSSESAIGYVEHEIKYYPLQNLLSDRKISKIPEQLIELHQKNRKNLAIKNVKNGYEVRGGGTFKGTVGESAPSVIKGKTDIYVIVEGIFDWLSLYQKNGDEVGYIILNSASNVDLIPNNIECKFVIAVDNDKAGKKATVKLLERYPQAEIMLSKGKDWSEDFEAGVELPIIVSTCKNKEIIR